MCHARVQLRPSRRIRRATADAWGFGSLRVPGLQPPDGQTSFRADWNAVSPDFFKTLHMRLVSGRDFTPQDAAGAPGAIIINETMARSVWQTTDVLGRQFETDAIGDKTSILTVVGVAPDAQVDTLGGKMRPFVYVAVAQRYTSRVSLLVKSSGTRDPRDPRTAPRTDPNLRGRRPCRRADDGVTSSPSASPGGPAASGRSPVSPHRDYGVTRIGSRRRADGIRWAPARTARPCPDGIRQG